MMRLASRVICLIMLAWFVVFAVDQTSSASLHQQKEVDPSAVTTTGEPTTAAKRESTLHHTLDEASNALTSPFAGVVSGLHSEWTIHIVKTLLALLVYGFGLAFLARFLSVRV